MHDDDDDTGQSLEEYRKERKEKMEAKFPKVLVINIRSEKHFVKIKLKCWKFFGKDNFKKTWYLEDVTGKKLEKLFYDVKQGQLLDKDAEGDIKPTLHLGVTEDIDDDTFNKFHRELKKLIFKTSLTDIYDQ